MFRHTIHRHRRAAIAAMSIAATVFTACAPQPATPTTPEVAIDIPTIDQPTEVLPDDLIPAPTDELVEPVVDPIVDPAAADPTAAAVVALPVLSSIHIAGSVWCRNGTPVKGVWVESSGGGGRFTQALAPSGKPELAAYATSILTRLPTMISIHVGCGGTRTSWGSDLWTPTMKVTGTTRINAVCSGKQGVAGPNRECSFPAVGSRSAATTNPFPMKDQTTPYCTRYAADQWKAATGSYPTWGGNAHQWNEQAERAGWTVVSKPMARSIVVWEAGPGNSSWGHVAWVRSVDHRADGSVWLTVRETNRTDGKQVPGQPAVYERVVRHVGGEHYILAPNKSGVA